MKKLILLPIIFLAACSSLESHQKTDTSTQQAQVYEACLVHDLKKARYPEDTVASLCKSSAKLAIGYMEDLFDRDKSEAMFEACGDETAPSYQQCLFDFQDKYYARLTSSFIKKKYPNP